MANYPQELAQDAVCQSHTGHMTGLWFLPTGPLRLDTNEWIYYCRNTVYFHLRHGLSNTLNITCTTSMYGQSVRTLRTPFVYRFERQYIVICVKLYVNLVKISKCNCIMCIFGEPVGTSRKPFCTQTPTD